MAEHMATTMYAGSIPATKRVVASDLKRRGNSDYPNRLRRTSEVPTTQSDYSD